MLGFGDIWVFTPFILLTISTLLCLFYSLYNWHNDSSSLQTTDNDWLKEEANLEEGI